MKIIGGKKDYYDYMVSKYGRDEHIVFDRRNKFPIEYLNICNELLFHVCGEAYPIVKMNGKWVLDFDEAFPPDERGCRGYTYGQSRAFRLFSKYFGKKTDVNLKMRCPIVCERNTFKDDQKLCIPCLQDFGFASYIDADDMYQRIYSFLSFLKDHPEIPNKRSDKEKIVSHGFDVQSSFRPKIK